MCTNELNQLADSGLIEQSTVADMARMINAAPELKSLSDGDKAAIIKATLLDVYKEKLKTAAFIQSIDFDSEKATFIETLKSKRTADLYRRAIERLEQYADTLNKHFFELDYADADNFIYSQKDRAAASVRLDIAAVNAFFTFAERRHKDIKNPFRGTKARPKKASTKPHRYDNILNWKSDVETIMRELPADLAAAVSVLSLRGLRIGALPTLTIGNGGKFTATSKGKEYKGVMPAECLKAIKAAGLDARKPFDYLNKDYAERLAKREKDGLPADPEQCLKMRLNRQFKKMFDGGKTARKFSPHDFRHFYAVTEYTKDKDIHRVSKLLNHSSIQITETYLRGLNVIE